MKRAFRRRALIIGGAGFAAAALGARLLLPSWLRAPPLRPLRELSPGARDLVAESFDGIDPALWLDCHLHAVGIGDGGTGCAVNPEMRSHSSPIRRIQYEAYLGASGVSENGHVDADYLRRVAKQTEDFPTGARFALLAFDWNHDEHGVRHPEQSSFFVPNDYVAAICATHPRFSFFASVHPYRPDALVELRRVASLGATGIKWLPNAMGIDPDAKRCIPFYDELRELGLVLLTHTGHERAVHAEDAQERGNPLRLRQALERGVTVLVAHCSSLGTGQDLDVPSRPEVSNFALFKRLMNEPRYEGRLFGDISATPLVNRDPSVSRALIERSEFQARLVHGSDYPVVAIDLLVRLGRLEGAGLLDARERPLLREVFLANPLLFSFVLERRLRVASGNGWARFAPSVFEGARLLRRPAARG